MTTLKTLILGLALLGAGMSLGAAFAQGRPRFVRESVSQVAPDAQVLVFRDEMQVACTAVYVAAGTAVALGEVPCFTPGAWQMAVHRRRALEYAAASGLETAETEAQAQARYERTKRALIQQLKPEDRRVWETPPPAPRPTR